MVDIRVSLLKGQVENGMKLKELAEFYNLPVAQMKRVLKQVGLRIRGFRKPLFNLIDDTITDIQMENLTSGAEFEEPILTNAVEAENQSVSQVETEIAQEISW